ncbi:MAG: diguanylate cyclase [Gemmatimonadota bacterium]|nr:diguanylate cyclase [Gemmatimonadota bacterium]
MSLAPRILVADDDQALTRTLSWILKTNGYECIPHHTGDGLVERLRADPYDLLLLDIMLPGADGLQILAQLKQDPRLRDLPVLVISSVPPEEATVRALGLGAVDFVSKPFRVRELLARLKTHLRAGRELNQARAEARSRSEMVEILQEITATLKPEEIYDILTRRIARALKISRCSLIFAAPGDDQAVVVAAYENPVLRNLPVSLSRYPEVRRAVESGGTVLVTDVATDPLYSTTRAEWEREGRAVPTRSAIAIPFALRDRRTGIFFLRTTAEDTPLNATDMAFAEQVSRAASQALEKAFDLEDAVLGREEMKALAETDPLTGAFNRRALTDRLVQEVERSSRYQTALSCLMIDVDGFKQINDAHGHLAGDAVLRDLGALLRAAIRSVDVVARYGGEEFMVLLPETDRAGARVFAERLRQKVAGTAFGTPERPVHATVSIGISTYPDERVGDGEGLIQVADQNLYKAKLDGRNRYRD